MLSICNKFHICSKPFLVINKLSLKPIRGIIIQMAENNFMKIGTHDGIFHCDESLACFLVQQLPKFKNSKIIRSRDQSILDTCNIVIDVGNVYDPKLNLFDHHQKSFNFTLSDIYPNKTFGNIKLSSAGLVYAHFGHDIITQLLGCDKNDPNTDKIFDKVYENFIKEVDGIDNGINMFDEEPRYKINTNLSSRVSYLAPNWGEESNDEILYERFLLAVELTGKEFVERVKYYGTCWLLQKNIYKEAFDKRFQHDASGKIIVLEKHTPGLDHLFDIEEENNAVGTIEFILFPDRSTWRVKAMPVHPKNFELRKGICSAWRGLRNEELDQVSGIKSCVFVHSNGFIGGNNTFEGALEMAKKSI